MKKIFRLFIYTSLLIMSSCSLDADLKSAITTNGAWETSSDAKAAMYGMLSRFRGAFSSDYIYWGEYRTGLWGPGAGNITQTSRDQVYANAIPATHSEANWGSIYTTINDANLILKHVPSISFGNKSEYGMVMGNALFVRAFCYYWIVRIWGDAPLLLDGYESEENMYPTRSPKADIFAQIEKDLSDAENYLKDVSIGPNYANIDAVHTLQTDMYLWLFKVEGQKDALSKARVSCNAVLGKRTLLDNFSDVFSVDNKNNAEEIFVISMIKDEAEGGAQADWLVPQQDCSSALYENPVKVGSHQQWTLITSEYRDLLSSVSGDTRASVTYQSYYDAAKKSTHVWMNKYSGTWMNSERSFNSDYIFYRYPDVLLFDAEISCAEGQPSNALKSLNAVAKRAYKVDNYYPATLTSEEILNAILNERLKEFCCEGKLWWDYIRMGVVFSKVPSLQGKENKKNILLWPISQTSLNQNPNLTQTDIEY
jgi:hypothetical protein